MKDILVTGKLFNILPLLFLLLTTGFAIAGQSGVAVWESGHSDIPQSACWDGAEFDAAKNTAEVGAYRIMTGANSRTRDEIIVLGIDEGHTISGLIRRDGVWEELPFNNLATVSDSSNWCFGVAYERTSGDALIVWNNGRDDTLGISFRTWNGISWSAEDSIALPASGECRYLKLAANPQSDEMALAVTNSNNQDFALIWNGSSWGNRLTLDNSGGDDPNDANIAYEQQSGRALVVYSNNNSSPSFRTWNGAWSTGASISKPVGVSSPVRITRLSPDLYSDRIALGIITESNGAWLNVWDGESWGSGLLATSSVNGHEYQCLDLAFNGNSGTAWRRMEAAI
jgi:hypothetical protein